MSVVPEYYFLVLYEVNCDFSNLADVWGIKSVPRAKSKIAALFIYLIGYKVGLSYKVSSKNAD